MKKLLLLLITIAGHRVVSAQQLPNIIPPSPQSREFFKHLDYPPGNSSGAINFSIPIYEVKSGSLSLPVSIGYMSGGSKQTDVPGDVGYGWTLDAGGRISRTIYGKPDEAPNGFPDEMKSINSSSEADDNYDYVASLYQSIQGNSVLPIHDSEYDVYSYSFGGNSGKFIYNEYESKVYTIPEKPYLVDGLMDEIWTIVDDKGITYKYSTMESVYPVTSGQGPFPTSRLLNYIISADKKDTISIVYQQLANQTNTNGGSTSTVHDNFTSREIFSYVLPAPYVAFSTFSEVNFNYVVFTVKEIHFRGGKMVFTTNSANDGIDYIKVFDKKGELVKQVQLIRSSGNLTDVRFKDITGADQEKYAFEYYPGNRGGYQTDFYGYLKYQGGLVPHQYVAWKFYDTYIGDIGAPYEGGFYAGPNVGHNSTADSQVGMLKKVTYPTGGTAEYSYDLNQVLAGLPGEVVNSGGMRLAEVKLTDDNGSVHYRTYRYGNGTGAENGYGLKQLVIPASVNYPGYLSYEMRVFPWINPYPPTGEVLLRSSSYRRRTYTSSFLPQITEAGAEPTFYPEVTVYEGTLGNNTGKTVYRYRFNPSGSKYHVQPYPNFGSGNYEPAAGVPTFYNDYNFDPIHTDNSLSDKYHIQEFNLWQSFPLEDMTVYKRDIVGNYEPVKKVVNNYNYVQTNSFKGLHIVRNLLTSGGFYEGSADSYAALNFKLPVFLYDNYYVTTGREELTSTEETLYAPTGNVVTTTSYEYNSKNLVNKVTKVESNGDPKISIYSYSMDNPSVEPYATMISRNILSPIVEEKSYKALVTTGNFLQSTKTDYSFWDNAGQPTTTVTDAIYPKLVSSSKTTTGYEPRVEYSSYDAKGNITSARKSSGPYTSYIWGYNKQYPIAQAVNTAVKNIFHENFEEGAGNSTLNDARTGHYSKTNAYAKALSGLDAGSYILSYWKKTGGVWTYQTSTVTVSGSTYNISIAVSAGERLDDVCFYPVSAQMSTYTYDPLVGTTSTTDPRGETTFYDYDNFQRLLNVRDKDGNIIKRHQYNYKN